MDELIKMEEAAAKMNEQLGALLEILSTYSRQSHTGGHRVRRTPTECISMHVNPT
jgi:hypothetical protein